MERLKTSGSLLATELRFACWITVTAVGIACQCFVTLADFFATFVRSLWRMFTLLGEVLLEACISFVRFLWSPRFWQRRRGEKSGPLPGPLFDVAVVTTLIVFGVLANANF